MSIGPDEVHDLIERHGRLDLAHYIRERPDLGFDDIRDILEDGAHRAHAADGAQLALGLVIVDERRRLLLVDLETVGNCLLVIVRAVRQRTATLIALVGGSRRREIDIVDRTAGERIGLDFQTNIFGPECF